MNQISHFKIEVDISLCEKLYDYGNSEVILKPTTGKWNKQVLLDRPAHMVTASRGYSLHDTKHRIRRLDSVFHHLALDEVMIPWSSDDDSSGDEQGTGFAVPYVGNGTPEPRDKPKFHLDDTDDSVFEEDTCKCVDLPPRILPLFRPEDTIKGIVHITLNGDIPATHLLCKLEGSIKTKIKHRTRLNTGSLKVQESFRRGKKECVSQTKCLWIDQKGVMKKGEHKLPFEFVLPKDCPGSTPDLLPPEEKEYAYVGYRLKAMITQSVNPTPGDKHIDDIVLHRGLWVEKCIHMSDIDASFLKPYIRTEVIDTGVISKGKVSCKLKLPKRVFVRGEKIPLLLQVNNGGKLDILEISCRVKLKGNARSSVDKHELVKHFALKGSKVKESGIPTGQQAEKHIDVLLDVQNADVSMLPVSHFQGSGLLEVNYFLCITLRRQGISRNITLDVPIKVVSHN